MQGNSDKFSYTLRINRQSEHVVILRCHFDDNSDIQKFLRRWNHLLQHGWSTEYVHPNLDEYGEVASLNVNLSKEGDLLSCDNRGNTPTPDWVIQMMGEE